MPITGPQGSIFLRPATKRLTGVEAMTIAKLQTDKLHKLGHLLAAVGLEPQTTAEEWQSLAEYQAAEAAYQSQFLNSAGKPKKDYTQEYRQLQAETADFNDVGIVAATEHLVAAYGGQENVALEIISRILVVQALES